MMKSSIKTLFVFITLLFFTDIAQSQISFGIKGGVNLAELNFKVKDLQVDAGSVNGFTLGALLEIGFGGRIFLQPEVVFIQKGSKLQLPVISTETKIIINYLDIPILLKVRLIDGEVFNINIFGGPSFGYAINGESTTGSDTEDIKFTDGGWKRFDLGLNAGGGLGINFGGIGVFADARYLFGVSNVNSNVTDTQVNNRGINLNAGLIFKIAGK